MSNTGSQRIGQQIAGRSIPRATVRRGLVWPLVLALYAVFLWRTPYGLKAFSLYVLDWLVPVIGLGTWLVTRWRTRASWPSTSLDVPVLGWVMAVLVSTAFSTDLRNSLRGAWELFVGLLILWMLVDAIRRGWSPVLWRATYLVGGVVCLLAAAEFLAWYFGWPLLPDFQQGWPGIGGLADLFPPTLYRLRFTLVEPTVLSAFIALLIPPAVTIAITTQDREARAGMLLWLAAATTAELLSLSRGGFLALGVSLPLLLLGAARSPRFRRLQSELLAGSIHRLRIAAILMIVAVTVAAGFVAATRLAGHNSGDAVRLDLWHSALEMLRDRPLTGVGLAAFGSQLRLYRNPLLARDHVSTAHNLYLNTGAELGLLGLLAGAGLLFALTWAWWRRWQTETPGSAGWWRVLGVGAALAGLAAQMLVETFAEPAILLPAAFCAAVVLGDAVHTKNAPVHCRRWPWVAALIVLVIAAVGMAWDTWGYAPFGQSIAWIRQGNQQQALRAAQSARAIDPWMPLYACHAGYLYSLEAESGQKEALDRALQQYTECMAKTSIPGWIDHLNIAALLWQAGERDQALIAIQEATARTPLESILWLNQGLWAEKVGDDREAVISYGRVLALDPELAGSPFWQQGQRAQWWDEIIASEEDGARWQLLVAAGRWEQAAQQIRDWLDLHPEDAEAMAWLGEALLDQGDAAEADTWLDRSLQKAPSRARSYLARGEAELALGDLQDAERDMRIALFLKPEPRVHLGLARLAQARGANDEALAEYARAFRPLSLSQAYFPVLYHRLGWPALLPQVAIIGYREDGEAALEWGRLLEERGDVATARRVYQAALQLDSSLEQVRERLKTLDGQ